MDDQLRLVTGPPALEDYRRLRAESGLSPKSVEQARAGLHGAWAAVHVRDRAPAGAYVTLMADRPGRPLYARHGFVETAPDTVGMMLGPT